MNKCPICNNPSFNTNRYCDNCGYFVFEGMKTENHKKFYKEYLDREEVLEERERTLDEYAEQSRKLYLENKKLREIFNVAERKLAKHKTLKYQIESIETEVNDYMDAIQHQPFYFPLEKDDEINLKLERHRIDNEFTYKLHIPTVYRVPQLLLVLSKERHNCVAERASFFISLNSLNPVSKGETTSGKTLRVYTLPKYIKHNHEKMIEIKGYSITSQHTETTIAIKKM